MKENNKDTAEYIKELEDKIVDLSLQLRSKKNELNTIRVENYEQIRKIVHNLKNPIGVAYSFSEMVAEEGNNLSSEKFEKYINVIKNSAQFSIDNLNALASLNRLKSPKFILNCAKTNYIDLLNSILETFKTRALERNIIIKKDFPSDAVYLNLDTFEIEKAIQYIIHNAFRYSPNNSTIQVSIRRNEEMIETVITDEGIGISEESLPAIFDEFFVVNTYSIDSEKCIGLGLSMAKIVFDAHKSTIEVESILGKGFTFKLLMPLN